MAGVTLDTGALLAAERNDPAFWAFFKTFSARKKPLPVVPAPVLAQAWRGGPRAARLAALLNKCVVEVLDEEGAKRAGELLAKSGTADVVDAAVATGAAARGDTLLTSDPDDMRLLVSIIGRARVQDIATLRP